MTTKTAFLYEQIAEDFKEKIRQNIFPMGTFLPSEHEICQQYEVKRGTTRKALELLVYEGLIEKVPGVGSRVSSPSSVAPATFNASNNLKTIALVTSDPENNPRTLSQPFYSELFHHLEMQAKESNCQLLYVSNTQDNLLESFLTSQDFCSVVFISQTLKSNLEIANRCKIPALLVNERHRGYTSISYDGIQGAYMVVEHLVNHGHRNISFITGPSSYASSNEKLLGCFSAINAFELSIPKNNYAQGNWEFQSGYDCAKEIFSNKDKENMPTALFSFNDMMAIGAIKALQDMDYKVPEDISVVGFDNMNELKFTQPDLTTVDVNIPQLAKLIIRMAANPDFICDLHSQTIKLDTTLIERGTVKKLI